MKLFYTSRSSARSLASRPSVWKLSRLHLLLVPQIKAEQGGGFQLSSAFPSQRAPFGLEAAPSWLAADFAGESRK